MPRNIKDFPSFIDRSAVDGHIPTMRTKRHTPPHWRKRGSFWAGIVAGFASLASFPAQSPPIRYPHASDWSALRGDWLRIGQDMRTVVDREHARIEKKSKSTTG